MSGPIAITPWWWAGFIVCILFFLALDLGVFHRGTRTVRFKEALAWSAVWCALSMAFALVLLHWRGHREAVEYVTGYVIELSLSLDNVFVIALIFSYFKVAPEARHRLLFWGILGALVMRGIMIGLGVELVQQFGWLLYVLGGFLALTGFKMLYDSLKRSKDERNVAISITERFFLVKGEGAAARFVPRRWPSVSIKPLLLVLCLVEFTDLIFAFDSIPAVFSVTTKPFIVFTSNVFAILGLRSLYFVLAELIVYFRHLKTGLSVVLVFIGCKMLMDPHDDPPKWFQIAIPTSVSLMVVAGILLIAIALSVTAARRDKSGHSDVL